MKIFFKSKTGGVVKSSSITLPLFSIMKRLNGKGDYIRYDTDHRLSEGDAFDSAKNSKRQRRKRRKRQSS